MKTIEAVIIWNDGSDKIGKILNAYAVNVTLNENATFYYSIFTETETNTQGDLLQQGNLLMMGEAYQSWNNDVVAWDWIAEQLNLTITGDFIPPQTI